MVQDLISLTTKTIIVIIIVIIIIIIIIIIIPTDFCANIDTAVLTLDDCKPKKNAGPATFKTFDNITLCTTIFKTWIINYNINEKVVVDIFNII